MNLEPPPISTLQPMTPVALDHIVRRCLAKEPDERWQAASDVMRELKWIAESGPQTASLPAAPAAGMSALGRRPLVFGLVALLLVVAITGLATWNLKPTPAPPSRPVTRYTITLPEGQQLAGLDVGAAVVLSPDGTQLAYVAREAGTQQLYSRAMNSLEARPIPGTEGAVNPFFSPDSQWVAFFAGERLQKVSVSGGAVQTLAADAATPRGASWSSQGEIAFAPGPVSPLELVSDAGGTAQALTRPESGEITHRWPEFLPGGRPCSSRHQGTSVLTGTLRRSQSDGT